MPAAFVGLLATLVLLLAACVRDPLPDLVRLESVLPREVERGDRLEVRGQSFPQGRTARLRLAGEVRRAGRPPRAASVEALAVVKAPDRLEVVVDEAFETALTGGGDDAEHVAFHGTAEVAFAAATRGAPPLVGTIEDVVVDVSPTRRSASAEAAREAAGRAFVERLGVLRAAVDGAGLRVEEVAGGSPAERAGLDVGDVIVRADGVGVRAISDLAPQGSPSVPLEVRRSGQEAPLHVDVGAQGVLAVRAPEARISSGLLVVLVLGLLAWCMPLPSALGRLEVAVAREARAVSGLTRGALLDAFFATPPGGRRAVAAGVLGSALLLVGAVPSNAGLVGVDVDVVALAFVASCLGAAAGVARARGAKARLAALGASLLLPLVLASAIAAACLATGSVRTDELVRGGLRAAPRGALALAAFVALAASVAAAGRFDPRTHPSAARLDRLASIFAAATLAVVAMGALPDATPGASLARFGPRALGFVAATLLVDVALLAVRRATSLASAPWRARLVALALGGASLAFALLAQRQVGGALVGALGVVSVVVASALVARLVLSTARLRVVDVDPFV